MLQKIWNATKNFLDGIKTNKSGKTQKRFDSDPSLARNFVPKPKFQALVKNVS